MRTVDARRAECAIGDLKLIAPLVLAGCALAAFAHANERLVELARVYQLWPLAELPIMLALIGAGAATYALRRWRELAGRAAPPDQAPTPEAQASAIPALPQSQRASHRRHIARAAHQRMAAERQRHLRETLLLNRVVAAASSVLEPTAVLEIVCAELASIFDLPQAAAALLNADHSLLTVIAEHREQGRPSGLGAVIPLRDNQDTQTVIKQRRPIVVLDAQGDPRQAAIHDLAVRRGTVSLLIVPLLIRDEVVGTIGLDALTQRTFSDAEIALAQNVANAASRALENAYLYTAVQHELTERHQVQQTLRAERDFIAAVLDTAAALVVVLDRRGRIVRFNRACEQATGYLLEEVSGQPFWDVLLPAEQRDAVKADFAQLYATQRPIAYENQWLARDGQRRLIAWSGSFLLDQAGAAEYMIGIGIEITDRRRAEETLRASEERFQLVVRATNDAIWDHNLLTGSLWWNDGLHTIFGYQPEDIEPTFDWWCALIHPDDQAGVMASYQAVLECGEHFWSREYRFLRSDGTYADVLDRAYAVYDAASRPVRLIGSMMDISERKQVERLKNEFVATVSHELRTPLTAIRGALSLVSNGVAGELPAQAHTMLAIALKNSERLLGLINDILDIEKIEAGKLALCCEPQELLPLIEQALDAMRPYGQQLHVGFSLEHVVPDARVSVNSDRLIQVLTNLLSNAAKFSPPGERVRVAMTREDCALRVAISDCGPGIPADFLPRLFQKFAQADASNTRHTGGTGLGLSIAKAIVEQLGGQIGFTSTPGAGTTFYVDLPEWQA